MQNVRAILSFVGGAAMAIGVVAAVSEIIAPVYPAARQRVANFERAARSVQYLTVGSSHNRAIDFDAMGVPGFHFWSNAQDVFESTYLALYAARRAPRLRYVLLPASYGVHLVDRAAITSRDMRASRREMYFSLRATDFLPGDLRSWAAAWMSPVSRSDHWYGVAAALASPGAVQPLMAHDGRPNERASPPILSADSLRRHGQHGAAQLRLLIEEAQRNDATIAYRAEEALGALADSLAARGVRLVLFTVPVQPAYADALADVAAGMERMLRRVQRRHPNVVWLDHSRDARFVGRAKYFLDSNHLNAAGAAAYSLALKKHIDAWEASGVPRDCTGTEP